MKKIIFTVLFFSLLLVLKAQEKPVRVGNMAELTRAIDTAKPGAVIILKDGEWKDALIDFKARGASRAPITIRAQNRGKVILTGNSRLVFNGPFLVADGLYFTRGSLNTGSVVSFRSDSCRFTQSAIVNYNPPSPQTSYHWIHFTGSGNRVDHSFFKGKNNRGALVLNEGNGARNNLVSFSHFKDIHTEAGNLALVSIQGSGGLKEKDGTFFILDNNFFERASGNGGAIVSMGTGGNIIRNNTFVECRGGIVSAGGEKNSIEANFIIGNKVPGTAGISIAGKGHRVINNYISEVAGDGLVLSRGMHPDAGNDLSGQTSFLVSDALVAHNTIAYPGGTGINLGAGWGQGSSNDAPPQQNRIINNLVYYPGADGIITSFKTDREQEGKENIFEGNISFGAKNNDTRKGIRVADPGLALKEGLYRLSALSPAVDKGLLIDIRTDIDGQARTNRMDVGADESVTGKIVRKPLIQERVGATWVISLRKVGSKDF